MVNGAVEEWRHAPHLAIRSFLAALWIYEGLWLKALCQNPHELRIVSSSLRWLPGSGHTWMWIIGLGETALGLAVLSGVWMRPLAWLQGILLVSMNLLGILLGVVEINDPIYLLIHNLPTFGCILVLATYSPPPERTTS